MNLARLPVSHILRNTPLVDIGARYRQEGTKVWRKVLPSFGIALATYNTLGTVWTRNAEWECDDDNA